MAVGGRNKRVRTFSTHCRDVPTHFAVFACSVFQIILGRVQITDMVESDLPMRYPHSTTIRVSDARIVTYHEGG